MILNQVKLLKLFVECIMKMKKDRCEICLNPLLHRETKERGICKKCEPDLTKKMKIVRRKKQEKYLDPEIEYRLL